MEAFGYNILESSSDGELVTRNEAGEVGVNNVSGVCNQSLNQRDNSHGDISVMSALDPLPGRLGSGLTNVVSMVVQCSPLRRQPPSYYYRRHEQVEGLL